MKTDIRLKFFLSILIFLLFPFLLILFMGGSTDFESNSSYLVIPIILTPFVAYFIILSCYIAKNYLLPLKKLFEATVKLSDGDTDFAIDYSRSNEMGRLCAAFEDMKEKLRISIEKQHALEKERKDLIESVSHDLRTPLSSIKGYVEGLPKVIGDYVEGSTNDSEKLDRYLSVIKHKTETIDSLIERLFLYSSLEDVKRQSELVVFDSAEFLDSLLSPIEREFMDSSLKLLIKRPFPSVRIKANETNIAQVFDNILRNAKKHAFENSTITIEVRQIENALQISITNIGLGIADEDMPYIFDRFYRAEKSRTSNLGGIGLGLAISKKIIENHGGKIWAESKPDKETKVTFSLPTLDT